MSFNQNQYINNYNKSKYKLYSFRIKRNETNLIKKLDNIDDRNSYIVNLLNERSNIYTLKEIREIIVPILSKYGISKIRLFGSYARGDATSKSDVDLYLDKGNIKTLMDLESLRLELIASLDKDVDIVFDSTKLEPFFKSEMEKDLIELCLPQKTKEH